MARFVQVARGLDEILAAFSRLVEEHDETADEAGAERGDNFRCVACERCSSCRFCTSCVDCDDCTYCDACVECHGCTQSRQCHGCVEISHSSFSAGCQRSSYLVLCYDCEDCVHCFACAGLSGEEFCVLNERVSRKEYFSLVSRLRAELDVRSTEGWHPPWSEPEPEPEPECEPEPEPELPRVQAFDDAWLDELDASPLRPPATAVPERPDAPPTSDDAARSIPQSAPSSERVPPASNPVAATPRADEGPTRPYPVVEPTAPRGPSLRVARRPPRRTASKG